MAEQHVNPDPTTTTVALSENKHKRLRDLRVLEARLAMMARLVNLIMVGWRVDRQKKMTKAEREPNARNSNSNGELEPHGRHMYLDVEGHEYYQKLYKALDLESAAGEVLENKHDHFAKCLGRDTFAEVSCDDVETIEKGETQSTDNIYSLEFPDRRNTRSYIITTIRTRLLRVLFDLALPPEADDQDTHADQAMGDNQHTTGGLNAASSQTTTDNQLTNEEYIVDDDFVDENQRDAITNAFNDADEWWQGIEHMNRGLVAKYDEFAADKGQPSFEEIVSAGWKLVEDADANLVRECELWVVDREETALI